MVTIGVDEAKTQLSKLLACVTHGERVTITRDGKPIAMLVPAAAASAGRSILAELPGLKIRRVSPNPRDTDV